MMPMKPKAIGSKSCHLRYKHKLVTIATICTTEAARTESGAPLAIVALVKKSSQNSMDDGMLRL